MKACAKCGKENQDHHRFCLGWNRPGVLAEARDFERFGMLDEAAARLEKVVELAPSREHRRALEALKTRRR